MSDEKTELTGGPEDQGKTEEKSGFGTELKIGDKSFMVNEDLANAIKAQTEASKKEMAEQLDELRSSLSNEFKSQLESRSPAKDEHASVEDESEKFYNDPLAYLKEFRETIKNEVTGQLRGEYAKVESEKSFWNDFYTDNNDLKDADIIVKAVMNRDWNDLKDLRGSKAKTELADRARKELLKFKPELKSSKAPIVEGEVETSVKTEESQGEKVLTLSDIIKKRKESRRKARISAG